MENVAYVFRLYPTIEQMVFFAKSFGCMRNYWNLALAEYKQTKSLVGPAKFKSAYPYLKEVDSLGLANVWKDLKQALQRHFANPKHFGMPRFKSKKFCKDSYTTNNQHGTVSLTKKYIRLPKIGLVRCKVHRKIPDTYTLKSATISCNKAGQYHVSVLFVYEPENVSKTIDVLKSVGLDYKSDGLIVDSNGITNGSPKYYRKAEKKLGKLQRRLSRKQKGSANREKQRVFVAKLHQHIANQRKDFLHKLSAEKTNQYDVICVESLNMKTLANCSFHNGKATLDNGYGQFLCMLEYKCKQKGKVFVKVDKWYPSSQTCSCCGYKNPLVKDLKVRQWECPVCGAVHDRDVNAARNIQQEGLRLYLASL